MTRASEDWGGPLGIDIAALAPLSAIYRGDLRYADRFGDYLSDEYFASERSAAEQDLAR